MIPLLVKKLLVRSGIARHLPMTARLTDGGSEHVHYYSDKILAAPVAELRDPATFPEIGGVDVVNLNLGASQFDSPLSTGRLSVDRHGKPSAWGLPALRETISGHYRRRDKRFFDPRDEVFITHGATGAYSAVLDAFVNPGNRVVLFDPCSPLFAVGAKSRRASISWVPTTTENGVLKYDADTLSVALRGAKLIVLADPTNPTGASFTPDAVEHLLWAASRSDVLIYQDESFRRFRYDGAKGTLNSRPASFCRTLSAGSITQTYGLGSARVGWLAGPRHLMKACALAANLSAPFVPTVCQQLALRELDAEDELFGPVLEEFRARRRYTADRLKTMGIAAESPASGYFFWLDVSPFKLDGRTFAERLMKEHRVLVGPGCVFGPSSANSVRLSFAIEDGRLREGLSRLATFVAKLRGQTPVVKQQETAPVLSERPPTFTRV